MRSILKTTLAAAFAAACISGASVAFAADSGNGGNNNGSGQHGMNPGKAMNNNDSDVLPTDPNTTGSIKCNNNSANAQSGCDDTNGTNYNGTQQ